MENKVFHQYECKTGCGHVTVVDKFYQTKRMYCAVCGTKETLVYKGKAKVKEVKETWLKK